MTADIVRIREVDGGDADLEVIVSIVNGSGSRESTSVEEIRWAEATYPGATRLLAELDGRPVGAASVGRIYMHPPEFDGLWATLHVLETARRRGIGSRLLDRLAERARTAGKTALHIPVWDDRPDAVGFLLRRGFREYERDRVVQLDLVGLAVPPLDLPAGITLTTLADRPDLVTGVHELAVEAFADIPGGDEPTDAGDLAAFRARDVDRRSIPPAAFKVALDATTGRVVGYASLLLMPGQPTAAWHDMTAVARSWRGRGVAGALKRATIAWAIQHGLERLETGNDVDNAPMRAVNAKLGYRPLADRLVLRGPAGGAIMDR